MGKQEQIGDEASGQEVVPQIIKEGESKIDIAYSQTVARYFNRRKEDWMRGNENPSEEDLRYEQFLTEQQNVLAKLANCELAEKAQPKDFSFALSELAGMMSSNREIQQGVDQEALDQEKEYLEAKKIFLATCRKLFPEIEAEITADIPYIEVGKLNRSDISSPQKISMSEVRKLLKDDPKTLTRQMSNILDLAGDQMKGYAFDVFKRNQENDIDDKGYEEWEKKLGMASMSVYKLQLMRDSLVEKVYGKKDITPAEEKEIDRTIRGIK